MKWQKEKFERNIYRKSFQSFYHGRVESVHDHGRHVLRAWKVWTRKYWVFGVHSSIPGDEKKVTIQRDAPNKVRSLNFRWADVLMWLNIFLFLLVNKHHLRKNSLIRTLENGIHRRAHSKFYTKKPVCVNRQNFQSISIDDSLPALLIVPFGSLLSLGVLLVERLLNIFKANNQICMKCWALKRSRTF